MLRFATDSRTSWPTKSSSSDAQLAAAEAELFVQVRACLKALMRGGSPNLLRGAVQLACAPLVSCASREQSHSMLSSFASRILSIGNLMAEIKDPISTDMLIGAIDLKVTHQGTLRRRTDYRVWAGYV